MAPSHLIAESPFTTAKLNQDAKRERQQRAKWAHGSREKPAAQPGQIKNERPVRPRTNFDRRFRNIDAEADKKKWARSATSTGRLESDGSNDNESDDEVAKSIVQSVPDAGVTYSFDADSSPTQGSGILQQALSMALERHETKVTEKLVRDEYEVLDKKDEVDEEEGVGEEVDGFELV